MLSLLFKSYSYFKYKSKCKYHKILMYDFLNIFQVFEQNIVRKWMTSKWRENNVVLTKYTII